MIPGARLVLLGRQGSGKGTQCVRLSRHFVVPHISTGDMLRAAVREGTELGKMAKAIIDAGGLVGDDIMVGLVSERLAEDDARVRGYILDGFPRTVSQAESLDKATASRPLDLAIDLVVPRELVLDRLSLRRVCRDCGTNYQATDTRIVNGVAITVGETWCSATTTPRRPSIADLTSMSPKPSHSSTFMAKPAVWPKSMVLEPLKKSSFASPKLSNKYGNRHLVCGRCADSIVTRPYCKSARGASCPN